MYRQEFINYIKRVEGSKIKNGFHHPYPSPEGGMDTIGYGHKLQPGESSLPITEAQAEALLVRDLNSARVKAAIVVGKAWTMLPEVFKEICIDFTFNLGKEGFAKFVKLLAAIRLENWILISKAYRRFYRTPSGEVKELKERNREFFEFFIQPNLR